LAEFHRDDGLKMTFEFLSFPMGFRLSFLSGEDVLQHQDKVMDTGANGSLIKAMNNLQPVWN